MLSQKWAISGLNQFKGNNVDEVEIIIEKPRIGRPPKEIKWEQVLIKMQAGNSERKIAFDLNIHVDTLRDRFHDHFGISFSTYAANALQDRNENIEYRQYTKALEGDTRLLVWLGEVWVGQKAPDNTASQKQETDFQSLINLLSSQSSAFAKANNNQNTEDKSECDTGDSKAPDGNAS